jgi:CheY-like chemotaxis protein
MSAPTVLIIEDGDEYLENLSRFVPGPRYLQAHTGAAALDLLAAESVDLIYLDMRFDRIATAELMGDHAAATREHNGDPVRAWRHLQMNQGLYVLDALRREGYGGLPVILAYDFSRERKRYERLARQHPTLRWVPDAVTPTEIRELMEQMLG